MELRAVIEGLKALRQPCEVTVITDSQYVHRGITEWLEKWKAQGWKRKAKGKSGTREVLNRDLWLALETVASRHKIIWRWIKGHAGHQDNIQCDRLALQAARRGQGLPQLE